LKWPIGSKQTPPFYFRSLAAIKTKGDPVHRGMMMRATDLPSSQLSNREGWRALMGSSGCSSPYSQDLICRLCVTFRLGIKSSGADSIAMARVWLLIILEWEKAENVTVG
jgi:hypothetical protein